MTADPRPDAEEPDASKEQTQDPEQPIDLERPIEAGDPDGQPV